MTHQWTTPCSLNISALKGQLARFTHHQLTNHRKKEKSHLKYCRNRRPLKKRKGFFVFFKSLGRTLILLWGGEKFGFSGNQPQPSLTVTKILSKWKYCPRQINKHFFLSTSKRANTGPRPLLSPASYLGRHWWSGLDGSRHPGSEAS